MRIGVLAAEDGWHYRDLIRAAGENSNAGYELTSLSFGDLSAGIGVPPTMHTAGGTNINEGPVFRCRTKNLLALDRLIVRIMPAGTLQQIIFRMDLLNRLQAAGVRIINPPRAVEIAVDKYLSLAMLADAGIAVPETHVAQTVDQGLACFDGLDGKALFKPIFGSMGNGIQLIRDRTAAQLFFSEQVRAGEVLYLQRFIDHGDSDVRILVIGDHAVGMLRRRPGQWLTNVAQGATGHCFEPSVEQRSTAIAACRAVGCRIAGVDLLTDVQTGEEYVVDINAAPGWQEISAVTGIDIAALILAEVSHNGDVSG